MTITTTFGCAVAVAGYLYWGKLGSIAGFFVGSMIGAAIGMAVEKLKGQSPPDTATD